MPFGDPTRTGTVTSTNTNTSVLLDNRELFDGIKIKPQDIEENYVEGAEYDLEVVLTKLDANGIAQEVTVPEELQGRFTWKSSNTSVATFASKKDEEKKTTNVMKLRIKAGGRATITASLDDYESNLHYTDTINVLITRKATKIKFSSGLDDDAYAGVSLVLDEYVELYPEGSTDKITYTLVENAPHKATLKNGVLKINAKSEKGETVKIVAIGDEVRSDVKTIKVQETVPAAKASFTVSTKKGNDLTATKNSYLWLINDDGMEGIAEIKLTAKDEKTVSTDNVVSWTSKKPDIVAVETIKRAGDDKGDNKKGWKVTLKPKAVGTAQIVAKTSRGKSFTLKVVVKADLEGVILPYEKEKDEKVTKAYSGQTVQLKATQKFGNNGVDNFTDAGLKWEITGKNAAVAKKVASVNKSTGVLTIKPDISVKVKGKPETVESIQIKVSPSKKNSKGVIPSVSDTVRVNLKQINVTEIVVYENARNNGGTDKHKEGVIASAKLSDDGKKVIMEKHNAKKNPITVAVGDTKTFALYAKAVGDPELEGKNAASVLGWTVNNTKSATAVKNDTSGSIIGIKKGSPTITVWGSTLVNGKYKATKITLKASVTQPSKSIQLTTKNKGAYPGQTVSFKATLEKGSSTKAKDLEWTVTDLSNNDSSGEKVSIKSGKLKIASDCPAGTRLMIRVRVKETGASASMRIWVVNKTSTVVINDKDGNPINRNKLTIENVTSADQLPTLKPMVDGKTPGSDDNKVAKVTYTMNKQDYLRIVENADGTITLKPIQKGTVKITPVSEDGKKGKALTVTIGEITLGDKATTSPFSVR